MKKTMENVRKTMEKPPRRAPNDLEIPMCSMVLELDLAPEAATLRPMNTAASSKAFRAGSIEAMP